MTPARRFQFRLALALGVPNPDALLASIPDRIYREWAVYSLLEPFGEDREDLRAGIVAAAVANSAVLIVNALTGKRRRPGFKPSDFIPDFASEVRKRRPIAAQPEDLPDRLFAQVKVLNRLFGGEYVDRRVH